jgi:hypothetical protein
MAKRASLYVGGDTGPTHLAVAAGAPVAGLFGPTEWWRNGSPRPEDICIERNDISCRTDCHRRSCSQWICMDIPFAALFLGIYFPVMRVEAKHLAELFGEAYQAYARAVPLFLPRLSPYRDEKTKDAKFDRSLYMRYREYRAGLGLLIAWGLLALKAVFLK